MFVWGGDGTVQRCIDAVAGSDTAVAILPAGTANLLATNLQIPADLAEAVRIGLHGYHRRIDTGSVNGEHFAVMAFELTRSAAGQSVTGPLTEGLEPEARADLKPAQPEPAAGRRSGRVAAGVVVAWVLILGLIVGVGELITKNGNGNVLGDQTIPHWFAAHRTASWTHWSLIFTTLGASQAILIEQALEAIPGPS
jgi:Diacylglycerol kinase catalytic domain